MLIGQFGPSWGNTGSRDVDRVLSTLPDPEKEYLPPEVEEDTVAKAMRMTGSAIEGLGYILDTPGAFARGALVGDPLSVFGDSERRVSGREFNEKLGLTQPDDNPWLKAGLGLGTEILLDPLSMISMPMSALTKGGKAAKAAGLLDLAPIAAQRKIGVDAAKATMAGRYTDDAYSKLLPHGLARTPENYAVRPLLGPRYARTLANVDDVVKAADDPKAALDSVLKYLKTTGDTYDDIKSMPLGGAFGIGLPMREASAVFTPAGSEKFLDAMDYLGQATAWSKPSRIASSWFNQDVSGFTDPLDQMSAMRRSKMVREAAGEGRKLATRHAMLMDSVDVTPQAARLLGSDTLFSREGNDFLTRMFEGKLRGADRQIKQLLPGIDAVEKSWDDIRKFNVSRGQGLGMRVNPYSDEFGTLYSPRKAAELVFDDYGFGAGNALFNTATTEGFSRKRYLITPGGTDDIRQASLLPVVRNNLKNANVTDEQLGAEIAKFINLRHGTADVTADQGTYIAKALRRINKDLPSDYPLFAEHPVSAQARNIVNQEMASANAKFIYQSMAEAAINVKNTQVMGGFFRRLDSALNDVARRTGLMTKTGGEATNTVRNNLLQEISKRTGIPADKIDLSQMAVPEQVYNRLTRLQDFYSTPRAQEEVANMFNRFTSMTKAWLLAWPARHTRDMYSNLFASWLETGSAVDTMQGFRAAKSILAGNFDEAAPLLRELPQYQHLAGTQAIRKQFLEDSAQGGVLSTLATSDLLTTNIRGDINQLVPGSTPMTRLGAIKEMIPDGSRTPSQMLSDFTQMRGINNQWETRNPILNASTKLSDVNDSIARLGTFIALLRKGTTPVEAAKRVSKALVDYSSLTGIERHVFRNIFPWWAYNSRIGKYVVEHMMKQPGGRFAQVVRGMNVLQAPEGDTNIPTSLRQQFALRLPDWAVPYSKQPGVTTYAVDFDFPGVDVVNYKKDNWQDTIAELFNQSHPLARTLAETAMNRDFYSRKPLDQSTKRIDRIYQYLFNTPQNLPLLAKAIIGNIPGTQRPLNFLGGLADPRVPNFGERLLKESANATLGVKFRDVDENWAHYDLMQKLADMQRGWARSGMYSSIPDELFAIAPVDVQNAALTAKALASRHRKLQKQRELAGK